MDGVMIGERWWYPSIRDTFSLILIRPRHVHVCLFCIIIILLFHTQVQICLKRNAESSFQMLKGSMDIRRVLKYYQVSCMVKFLLGTAHTITVSNPVYSINVLAWMVILYLYIHLKSQSLPQICGISIVPFFQSMQGLTLC